MRAAVPVGVEAMIVGDGEQVLAWREEPVSYDVGGVKAWFPVRFCDSDMYVAMHTADYDQVARALPSEVIRPVRWIDGRALVWVSAGRWNIVTWKGADGSSGRYAPYGEVGVDVLTSLGGRPRLLPLLLGQASSLTLHYAVTSRAARDGGRVFGWPKFLADLDFTEAPTTRSVRVSDHGQHILTLTVHPAGRPRAVTQTVVTHVSIDGELREFRMPFGSDQQTRYGRRGGTLELGSHPVADQIRTLGVSSTPLMVTSSTRAWGLMPPPGKHLGPARDLPCYPGSDDDYARYTVTYPGTEPVDIYASLHHV